LLAEALAVKSVVQHLLARREDRDGIERAIALQDPSRHTPLPMRPRFVDAYLRLWSGELDEASEAFQSVWRDAVEHGEEGVLPLFAFWGGAVQAECWRGAIDAAASYADAASEAAARDGGDVVSALALSAQSCVHAYRGEIAAARREGREAVSLFTRAGWDMACVFPSGVLAFVELSSGNPAAAVEVFDTLARSLSEAGVREPTATPFVPDAVEALASVGQNERAMDLLEPFELSARSLGRPWATAAGLRCRALLLAGEGLLDDAARAIEEAVIEHKRAPQMPVELGRTLLVQGQLLRRRKEKRAANAVLEEAVATFESVGASAWVQRARAELTRVGLRPRAPGALTPVEMQVAVLASRGLTVKEVAAQLFLSPKTAEGILGRVYRKLGVRTRAALATTMRGSDPPG
jgi:DNA-binding CsgD family transcriptional regulator